MVTRRPVVVLACTYTLACGPRRLANDGESGGASESETGALFDLPDEPPVEPPSCEDQGLSLSLAPGDVVVFEELHAGASAAAAPVGLHLGLDQDELLAFWLASSPIDPTLRHIHSRRLDLDGAPLGEAVRVQDRFASRARVHAGDGGFMLVYCAEWDNDRKATSTLVDVLGAPTQTEMLRSPLDRSCQGTGGAWTGSRHLVAWTDFLSEPSPTQQEVLVDIVDADGSSLGWYELLPQGDLGSSPRVAAGQLRSVVVSSVWSSDVHDFTVSPFEPDGEPLGPPISLARPDNAHVNSVAVVPGPAGFEIWASYDWVELGAGLLHWRLDEFGEPLAAEPTLVATDYIYTELEGVRRPGGWVLTSESEHVDDYTDVLSVLVFDANAELLDHIVIEAAPDQEWLDRPKLVQHDQTTYLLYGVSLGDRIEFHLRHLDCI